MKRDCPYLFTDIGWTLCAFSKRWSDKELQDLDRCKAQHATQYLKRNFLDAFDKIG